MKELASDEELWKLRYGEVVGEVDMAGASETSWKDKFGASMRRKKKTMRRNIFVINTLPVPRCVLQIT